MSQGRGRGLPLSSHTTLNHGQSLRSDRSGRRTGGILTLVFFFRKFGDLSGATAA